MIGIIGYGFVGQAIASVLNDEYCVVDPAHANGVTLDELIASNPSTIFVCVPTPEGYGGTCDDMLVMQYVSELRHYGGLLIIKSTVPVSTVEKIIDVRPRTVIWPELLREKSALMDVRSPRLVVLGATSDVEWTATHLLIRKMQMVVSDDRICYVTPIEASVFKYTLNSFLAVKVAFMHQMYAWLYARGEEGSWDTIAGLLKEEGRVGASHLNAPGEHGLGFGGHCLPKDMNAMLYQAADDGYFLNILDAANVANERLKKRNV